MKRPLQFLHALVNKIIVYHLKEYDSWLLPESQLMLYSKSKNTSISKFQNGCQYLKSFIKSWIIVWRNAASQLQLHKWGRAPMLLRAHSKTSCRQNFDFTWVGKWTEDQTLNMKSFKNILIFSFLFCFLCLHDNDI